MSYTFEEFIEKLKQIRPDRLFVDKNKIIINNSGEKFEIEFSKDEYDEIFNEQDLLDEYIVKDVGYRGFFFRDPVEVKNDSIRIQLSEISNSLFINAFMRSEIEDLKYNFLGIRSRRYNAEDSLIQFLKNVFIRRDILSIKVFRKDNLSYESKILAHSFLVNISLNKDLIYMFLDDSEKLIDKRHSRSVPRNRNSVDIPRRIYNNELVRNYQMAKSTDIAFVQYIAYYHILEHFFNSIYEEMVIKKLQKIVTSPKFTYANIKSYKEILKTIEKDYKYKNEQGLVKKEDVSLKLVLEKFMHIEDFIHFIKKPENEYYLNNDSIFSGDTKIIITETEENIIKRLAKRIYNIRNALVHSKDGEKIVYQPFKHDNHILQEIPLIKYVAEEILVNSSRLME